MGVFEITAQFPDIFIMENKGFAIAGVNGELFVPEKWGIYPISMNTACWRGYIATYTLLNDILVLNKVDVNLGEFKDKEFIPKRGPEINGIKPAYNPKGSNNQYNNLDLPIIFTGGLIMADDFISELYIHMGFHPAWKYKEVYELIFDNGKLKEKRDLSSEMAQIREELSSNSFKN